MICDLCKKNPAVYGDGITEKLCAECKLKQGIKEEEPQIQEEGTPHQTIEGMTSIVIPVYMNNYQLFHLTGNCIGSVREHTQDSYELIVVDNGSSIQPPNLQAYYADKVIKWDKNNGVSRAWNAGIRASFGEYIVLLNNDTQVYQGWLEGLKEALNSGLDLVMAHPMYSLSQPFARAVESGKVLKGETRFDPLEKDFSCVMFKKSLVDEVGIEGQGLFNEEFFNYCSDSDLFRRMDEAGKKYGMVDKVAIHHVIDATGYSIPETPEIMNKDKETFDRIWSRPPQQSTEGRADPPAGDFIRSDQTGDRIFFLKDNVLHWIKNPQVYEALGGEFGKEMTIEKDEFQSYDYGEPIEINDVEKYL